MQQVLNISSEWRHFIYSLYGTKLKFDTITLINNKTLYMIYNASLSCPTRPTTTFYHEFTITKQEVM